MNNSEKASLRKRINERRKSLGTDEIENRSSVILGKLEVSLDFLKAKTVLIYWAMKEEVQTRSFIEKWSDVKQFILPQVNGDKLVLRKFTDIKSLKKGKKLPIMEPTGELYTNYNAIDLAIIPAVAYDRKGNRLGRGKGYYDQLLPLLPKTVKIGIAFDFQVVKEIPVEDHDIAVDEVFTD